MKIISWNINWIHKNINKNQSRIEENEKRVKVAIDIINEFNPDILSLLEAGISESPEIEGYNKICFDRKYIYNGYKNGIVVYIKNDYKYRINEDVLKEIKAKNIGCFLPITIYKYNKFFNCFFVWTTVKNKEKGQNVSYGYNRIKEILELEKTVEFLNAKEKNVIFIGDFNLVSNHKKYPKKQEKWREIKDKLEAIDLKWKENNKNTFNDTVINDHCFLSKELYNNSILKVGSNQVGEITSDHKFIKIHIIKI